jgi:aryl-phospho-beta-D-glucosidase BglC (GH1 family)
MNQSIQRTQAFRISIWGCFLLFLLQSGWAQSLPTAKEIATNMGLGWNLGNTMEALNVDGNGNVSPSPTAWGNEIPSQEFINLVKESGFNTLRIPVSWHVYADPTTHIIPQSWFNDVKTVVDRAYNAGMYVIINIHWDNGWLENNITANKQNEVNALQQTYWTQIATFFEDYDEHLLFAGTNEPGHKDNMTSTEMTILLSYLQTFVDAVRATGGNNSTRTLIVQGPKTDIETTYDLMNTLPTDPAQDRMMAEVHFYPYQFTLMENEQNWGTAQAPFIARPFYYWGQGNHSQTDTEHNPTWGEEAFVDSMFNLMKTQFVDQDIPVLIGEFGAVMRTTLTGANLDLHLKSREAYYEYVAASAKSHGLLPVLWDPGFLGNMTMAVFDRKNNSIYDVRTINALRKGWGMTPLDSEEPTAGSKAAKILYSALDSLNGQVVLELPSSDLSTYKSILVRAYVNGQSSWQQAGQTQYGFLTLNWVTMSGESWTWNEAPFPDLEHNTWKEYTILLNTSNEDDLNIAEPQNVNRFLLQAYSQGYNGTIYLDHVIFVKQDDSHDTLFTFDHFAPTEYANNVQSVELIAVDDVVADEEWKTATKAYNPDGETSVSRTSLANVSTMVLVQMHHNAMSFQLQPSTEPIQVQLVALNGQTIFNQTLQSSSGIYAVHFTTNNQGVAILQIVQNNQTLWAPVRLGF